MTVARHVPQPDLAAWVPTSSRPDWPVRRLLPRMRQSWRPAPDSRIERRGERSSRWEAIADAFGEHPRQVPARHARLGHIRRSATFLSVHDDCRGLRAPLAARRTAIIRGHLVAYGADLGGGSPDEPIATFVAVTDVATVDNARGYMALAVPPAADPRADALGKVVSTVIGADGSVAWISCERARSIGADLAIGRHAVCQRAGRKAWVYTARPPAPGAVARLQTYRRCF
jgi:hypothetical protein